MPPYGPVSRRDFITAFRQLGFSGPYSGGRHMYMLRGALRIAVPNPHDGQISINLLARILRQAGILREDWEAV